MKSELIVYGTYDPSSLMMTRIGPVCLYPGTLGDEKLIVYCNFSENTREVELPEEFTNGKVLISNYIDAKVNHKITLRPYEAIVIQKKNIPCRAVVRYFLTTALYFAFFNYYRSLPRD